MSSRKTPKVSYWGPRREPAGFELSTDFCIAGRRGNAITQPELNLPKSYMFNRIVDPAEFMLGENLNKAKKRFDQLPARQTGRRMSRMMQMPNARRQSRVYSKVLDIENQKLGMNIKQEVLSIENEDEYEDLFQEPGLLNYSTSASTMYDCAIRPLFDESGLFPYYPIITTQNRAVIRTSRLSFRTDYLEFPIQTIAKMSVFLTLVQGDEVISNIVEVEMKISKPGVWKPTTFHEFDWIVESDIESSLYVEVVAFVRIPSDWRPFNLKASLIADNVIKFVDYRKGMYQTIKENKHHIYLNRKGEMPAEGQDAILSFYVAHSQMRYPYLPENFICPTSAIPIFEKLRSIIFKYLDPYFGNFAIWSPPLIEPTIFAKISASEKALYMLTTAWIVQTDKSLLDNIKKIYPATKVLSKTGSFCLLEDADSEDKATMRVAAGMISRKFPANEKYVPFHTDELRWKINISIPDVFS